LTRGLVSRLQLLLDFARAVILMSETRGIHYCMKLENIPTWKARFQYLFPLGKGCVATRLRE
jgi:hypothetical protein